MKLMTYNILNGGEAGLDLVINTINAQKPDFLTINEANTFTKNHSGILKNFAKDINLPYYDIALSGEYDYHVAIFSKYPFKEVHKLQPLARACLITTIDTEVGLLSVGSLHLTPYTEDLRHPEIDLILNFQKKFKKRILMGDMNSLARHDRYNPDIIKGFNDQQIKKFTTDGKLRFDAIDKILSCGYYDIGLQQKKNSIYTAPTSTVSPHEYKAHSNMRLDYIFVSELLLPNIKGYEVIKNEITEKASDHYPVIAELS